MISVSIFRVFIVLRKMPPGVGVSSFLGPGDGGFELFFARGVGNSPIKNIARGDGQAWN